jgi:mRNA interferase RelE/StbE
LRRLKLFKAAGQFLDGIPQKHAVQILKKLKLLCDDDKNVVFEQLIGHFPYLRLKSGEYRIIFTLSDDEVIVDTIGRRNDSDVYKKFLRS